VNNSGLIDTNIERLASFDSALSAYFEKSKKKVLYNKMPLREKENAALQRLNEGSYLLRNCGIEINVSECNQLTLELLDLLKHNLKDHEETISTLADLFIEEKLSPSDILVKILKNEGNELRKIIRAHNIPEDLFTFFAVYLARPFRETCAEYLLENIGKYDWGYGYCPICGHWPALGHIGAEIGARTLWCLCCNTKWNFKRIQCAFCLNEDHEQLEILNPENEESYRVHACKKCKRYLKEVRSNFEVKNFPFDKIYLGTLPLDIIAEQEGYIHESMLTVRYENPNGNELLMYRQKELKENGHSLNNI